MTDSMYNIVMEKLNFDPRLDASNITVSIQGNNDIVLLSGKVGSFTEKLIAERAVKNLANIKAVANDIEVDLATQYRKTDIEIAKEVTNALTESIFVPSGNIKVVVKDGVVILSGEVNWQYQKNSALSAINNLFGIKSIINNIVIKSSISINANKVKEQITKEFERHARIDARKIEVTINNRTITLSGTVRNFDEIEEATKAAWSIPGVEKVENKLVIDW